MKSIQRLASFAIVIVVLAGCGSVTEVSAPLTAAATIAPIDETYIEVLAQFTFLPSFTGYTFPAARYLPVKRQDGGVFYESPLGIKVKTIGGSYLVKGGIFRADPDLRKENPLSVYAYMPSGALQIVPLHAMIGLDLNKKLRCVPPLSLE